MANAARTLLRPVRPSLSEARAWLITPRGELTLIISLMLIGLLAQTINMFNYPSFTLLDDEGIYAGQARAVLEGHGLTPYTYFYDHAPVGWLLIALWDAVTGGIHTFGSAIDSGRILMLLLHLAMIPLLFGIARKLGCSPAWAAFATLLFSLSPLAIFYQRMVLLDNIMMFFVLLSLDLLLDGWGRLSRHVASGILFGLALLSKETAIFLLPVMILVAIQQRWKHQGRFAVGSWLLPFLMVASFYPLYALLKGELWPKGGQNLFQSGNSGLGGSASSVSLIDALLSQAKRDGGGLFNLNNDFWQLVRTDWVPRDAFLFVGGGLAIVVNLLRGIRDRRALVVGLLGLLPMYYLGRGGLALNYYVLFAIPFLALNLAFLFNRLYELIRPRLPQRLNFKSGYALLVVPVLVGAYWLAGPARPLYADQPAQAGREALAWIKQNLPADSRIIARDDLWTDLREPGLGGPGFPNVHSHWKVASDPAVRDGVFGNDWHNVDYLIMSPDLDKDFQSSGNTVALQAYQHSHLVKEWDADLGVESLHRHQIVRLYKVDKAGPLDQSVLQASTIYLNTHFDQNGAWAGPDGLVTSEGQANALLRSVWTNDRATFDRTWQWTQQHLLNAEGLLAWQWQNGKLLSANTATDADTDTALALLMAGQSWNDPALKQAGQKMVAAIWQQEVATVKGQPYITAGEWADRPDVLAINPSYFAPYAYRIFAEADPSHDWKGVITTGYQLLFDSSRDTLGQTASAGLPPDWIALSRTDGSLTTLPEASSKVHTTRYGLDAPRTYWRVALDLHWSQDQRASTFLQQAGFLRDEINRLLQDGITRKSRVSAIYEHNGQVALEQTSLVGTTGAIAALATLDPASANLIYANTLLGGLQRDGTALYWGNPDDLYTQEWGWFGSAFYNNALPDLWHNPNQIKPDTKGGQS